jgi:hypothetical protein
MYDAGQFCPVHSANVKTNYWSSIPFIGVTVTVSLERMEMVRQQFKWRLLLCCSELFLYGLESNEPRMK